MPFKRRVQGRVSAQQRGDRRIATIEAWSQLSLCGETGNRRRVCGGGEERSGPWGNNLAAIWGFVGRRVGVEGSGREGSKETAVRSSGIESRSGSRSKLGTAPFVRVADRGGDGIGKTRLTEQLHAFNSQGPTLPGLPRSATLKVDQAARVRGLPDSSDWMVPFPRPCPHLAGCDAGSRRQGN